MSIAQRTAVLALAVVALALILVLATSGAVPVAELGAGGDVDLTRTWQSDTGRQATGNHHAATGTRVDGQGRVFAPISGGVHDHATAAPEGSHADGHEHAHGDPHTTPSSRCGLYALNGSTGATEWHRTVPAANCSIHSIADPTVADVAPDPGPEVLATSTTETLTAYRGIDGTAVFRRPLAAHGYTRPIVTNVTADPGPEILAVDAQGNVTVFAAPDGPAGANGTDSERTATWTRRWSVDLDGFVWAEPQVADLNGDGRSTVAIALGDGRVVALAPDGTIAWNRSVLEGPDGLTWATAVDAESDPGRSIVAAASGGSVVRVDGTGSVVWRRDIGAYAAVRATRDAGRDHVARAGGSPAADPPLVYATNRAGDLQALDARTGETVWRTSLTDADVQMTPPPSMGDVAGGRAPELVAVTNDGQVHVLDPTDGRILASGGRSAPILTHASLVDLDGDRTREIVVTYGDGRVTRFDASAGG